MFKSLIDMHESCHPANCTKCVLGEQKGVNVVQSVLPVQAKVLVIAEAPGVQENDRGIPLVGQSGQLFNNVLKEVHINRNDLAIANVVACRPPDNRAPKPKETAACFEFLAQEIAIVQPNLIVTMGNTALQQIIKGKGTITNLRGQWYMHPEYNCYVLPTYHPAFILRFPQERQKFVNDFKKVKAFMLGEATLEDKVETKYFTIETREQLDWLVDILNAAPEWSCDTETTSLNPRFAEIFIVTFSWAIGVAALLDERFFDNDKEYFWLRLSDVMTNKSRKIMQNGSFDIQCFWHHGISVSNFYADTMLQHYLLDEEAPYGHGLEIIAKDFTDLGGYDLPLAKYVKENGVKNYKDIPVKMIRPYALVDADVTYRGYKAMVPMLTEQSLDFVHDEIMIPTMKILAYTEYNGVSIDIPYLNTINVKYTSSMKEKYDVVTTAEPVIEYAKECIVKARAKLKAHWKESKTLTKKYPNFDLYIKARLIKKPNLLDKVFNINSDTQLRDFLVRKMKLPVLAVTKKKQPSVNDAVLQEYAKENSFCKELTEYRGLVHIKSTFIDGTLKRLEPDNKLHTNYLLHSTKTGRPSSRNPNLNNIPRVATAADIKDIFCGDWDPEKKEWDWLVEADLGQAEFRVWIVYSQDPQAIRDLNNGIDIHKLIAATGFHGIHLPKGDISYAEFKELVKDVTKDERNATKRVIFGLMYGLSEAGAAAQFGISVERAHVIVLEFFGRYKKAQNWLKGIVGSARRDGYVKNFFGRRRRLLGIHSSNDELRSRAERQACLRKGTIVYTDRGAIPIEEVTVGDNVYNLYKKTTVLKQILSHDKKEIIKITLDNTNFLELSTDHKVFILSKDGKTIEEVKVSDLTTMDYVINCIGLQEYSCIDYCKINFNYPYKFTKHGKKYHINNYNMPTVLDSNLAEFMGILIGDGCLTNGMNTFAISIGKAFPEFIERCMYLVKELFNYTGVLKEEVSKIKNKTFVNYSVNIHSAEIKKFLACLGISGTFHNKRIPKSIFCSPIIVRYAFIKGLMDTDGAYRKAITYTCYNYALARDLQNLFFSIGINTKVSKTYRIITKRYYYVVSILGKESKLLFLSKITSSVKHKQEAIKTLLEISKKVKKGRMWRAPLPLLELYRPIFYKTHTHDISKRNIRKGEMSLFTLRRIVDKFNLPVYNTLNLNYNRITKIEYTGIFENMYDLKLASKDKLFFANGIAVHNCNAPIQSGASDLVFLSMSRIYRQLWQQQMRSRMVLTVYDSVVFNCPSPELEIVTGIVNIEMCNHPFSFINVPISADLKIGTHWGSLVEIDRNKPWNELFPPVLKEIEKSNQKFLQLQGT